MTKIALISDIHANLEALDAVLAHIDAQSDIESIYCLGDVVGYGPDPIGVIDRVRERCEFCLLGNHDHALITSPIGFNAIAAGAIACQRQEVEPGILSLPDKKARWEFLHQLPEERIFGENHFVHASPRDKIYEYILPNDPEYNPDKMTEVFQHVENRCFVGHTHIPGVFLQERGFLSLEDVQGAYAFIPGEKVIFNVSSVGQPRDRDPRACYAVLAEDGLTWERVEYDVESTIRKVEASSCLDDRCDLRLREGR